MFLNLSYCIGKNDVYYTIQALVVLIVTCTQPATIYD